MPPTIVNRVEICTMSSSATASGTTALPMVIQDKSSDLMPVRSSGGGGGTDFENNLTDLSSSNIKLNVVNVVSTQRWPPLPQHKMPTLKSFTDGISTTTASNARQEQQQQHCHTHRGLNNGLTSSKKDTASKSKSPPTAAARVPVITELCDGPLQPVFKQFSAATNGGCSNNALSVARTVPSGLTGSNGVSKYNSLSRSNSMPKGTARTGKYRSSLHSYYKIGRRPKEQNLCGGGSSVSISAPASPKSLLGSSSRISSTISSACRRLPKPRRDPSLTTTTTSHMSEADSDSFECSNNNKGDYSQSQLQDTPVFFDSSSVEEQLMPSSAPACSGDDGDFTVVTVSSDTEKPPLDEDVFLPSASVPSTADVSMDQHYLDAECDGEEPYQMSSSTEQQLPVVRSLEVFNNGDTNYLDSLLLPPEHDHNSAFDFEANVATESGNFSSTDPLSQHQQQQGTEFADCEDSIDEAVCSLGRSLVDEAVASVESDSRKVEENETVKPCSISEADRLPQAPQEQLASVDQQHLDRMSGLREVNKELRQRADQTLLRLLKLHHQQLLYHGEEQLHQQMKVIDPDLFSAVTPVTLDTVKELLRDDRLGSKVRAVMRNPDLKLLRLKKLDLMNSPASFVKALQRYTTSGRHLPVHLIPNQLTLPHQRQPVSELLHHADVMLQLRKDAEVYGRVHRFMANHFDPDATDDSSSDSEGDYEVMDQDVVKDVPSFPCTSFSQTTALTPAAEAIPVMDDFGHPLRQRSFLASRWSWLQNEITALEMKIRQQTQIYRHLRNSRPPVELERRQDRDGSAAARVRSLKDSFVKRSLYRVDVRPAEELSSSYPKPFADYCRCAVPEQICVVCRPTKADIRSTLAVARGDHGFLRSRTHASSPIENSRDPHTAQSPYKRRRLSVPLFNGSTSVSSPQQRRGPLKFSSWIKRRKTVDAEFNSRGRPPSSKFGRFPFLKPRANSFVHSATDGTAAATTQSSSDDTKSTAAGRRSAAYDINDIVIDPSVAAVSHIERLPHTEIKTPGWRRLEASEQTEVMETGNCDGENPCSLLEGSSKQFLEEDASEAAFVRRHDVLEADEAKVFSEYKTFVRSTFGNRRASASTLLIDNNTMDQSSTSTNAALTTTSTDLALPATCNSVVAPAYGYGYFLRVFPLSDSEYEKLLSEQHQLEIDTRAAAANKSVIVPETAVSEANEDSDLDEDNNFDDYNDDGTSSTTSD